jgi:adenine-specific DNA glycosylase
MDYGARVCLPRPRCEACVIASLCAARPRFAAGEVAEPVRAQARFQDSDRMWRGRILGHLRDLPPPASPTHQGTTIAALMRRLAAGGMPSEERPRVRGLLDALAVEGLAWVDGARCGLGHRDP